MKNKDLKKLKIQLAQENINHFLNLLKTQKNPNYNKQYIKQILKLSEGFNIRLTKQQKLLFCKKCFTYFTPENLKIRINTKNFTKNYICTTCNHIKRFQIK